MTASLRILVPAGTTNYVKNPSCRYDTTGYTLLGSTLTRSLERARFGVASLKVVTNGAAFYQGFYYRINWMTGLQGNMTGSLYLRGTGIVRVRLVDGLSGKQWVSTAIALTDTCWKRFEVSGYCTGGNDVRLFVETDQKAQAVTFYADALQVELQPYATSYCDGDQEGCQWNIMAHNSLSTRSPYTRAGGRWVTLTGCERDEKNLYVTVAGGMGVAPIENSVQSYADSPGSYYQRQKVLMRVVTFTFHATSPDLTGKESKSLRALHQLRQTLYDLIKSDKTAGFEEFLVEYQDGDRPVYIKLRYDGGLDGEWDVRNHWVHSFPVRFIAVSPFFTDDNQEVNSLDIQDSSIVNYTAQRKNGIWSEMNGGVSGVTFDYALGKRGEIYACGNFTVANYKSTAIDPTIVVNFITYWDGTQWQKLGSGANDVIYSAAVAPNGDVYVVGAFTSIGGVACNRIAKWNGSAWSALGSGLNGSGFTVRIAPNGDVYVGGSFTQAGGNPAYYCAMYDGTWHPIGTEGGLNAAVNSLVISPDGSQVFLGGDFTDEYGSPGNISANYVALYEPLFNQFYDLGDGFDARVLRLALSPSGRLYACGEFTTSGSQPMLYISYWNGSAWHDMEAGANATVRGMDIGADGSIIAVGDFTRMGSVDSDYQAFWNGSSWVGLDVKLYGAGYAVIRDQYGNIFLSSNSTRIEYSGITLIENPGTAEAAAAFYIVGPATLRWIENQTAQRRIYADLPILSGEEVVIDCSKGSMVSAVRGDLSYAILPGSDLRAWKLIPGQNKVAVLMTDDMGASMQISCLTRHWSGDSTARADNFQ